VNDLNQKSLFEQLLHRNRGRLTAIARTYAGNDADDLLQEMLLQIWRALGGFQERSGIDTWCYRVALNTAISWQRSRGVRRQRLPASNADMQQIPADRDGYHDPALLLQFLQTLGDTDRALVLMYLEDMSGAEMAGVLGISAGALRVRIHRVKQKLIDWNVGDT